MQTGDLFVGVFVQPLHVGSCFSEWPLHITVVSWARGNLGLLEKSLMLALKDTGPFEVEVGAEAFYADGKVLVNEVDSPPLKKLFLVVKDTENKLGFEFVSTHHPSYRPHVTAQVSHRAREGDRFVVNRLYIVEQKGDYRQIVKEIPFGKQD